MISEEDKKKKDFRVFWQHVDTYNSFVYPVQEPFYTYEEAEKHVMEERKTGYLRAWVIDRQGLSY